MLKKSIIGAVLLFVLAIAVMPASAGFIKAHSWPVEFVTKDFNFKIPVTLDVALFIEIINQEDLVDDGILLTQDTASDYSGCADILVKCNVPFKLDAWAELTAAGDKLGASIKDVYVVDGDIEPTVCGLPPREAKVCIEIEDVTPYGMKPQKGVKVAEITLTAKPTLVWEWVDP